MRSARRWKRSSSPPGTAWKRNALPRSSALSRGTSGRLRNSLPENTRKTAAVFVWQEWKTGCSSLRRGEYSDVVSRTLEKRVQPKLSPTALEVLAIVAYYQPVTRSYIEQLRGTDSSYTVALLSERGLIAPCGRLEAPGRPVLFGTTDQFLRVVGISSIEELPPLPNVATGEGIQELQAAIDAASDKDEQLKITEIE